MQNGKKIDNWNLKCKRRMVRELTIGIQRAKHRTVRKLTIGTQNWQLESKMQWIENWNLNAKIENYKKMRNRK